MSKKKGFSCPVCDSLFEENNLESHVQSHFNDDDQNKEEPEEVQCQFHGCCLIVNIKNLDDHMLAHQLGSNELPDLSNDGSLLAAMLQQEENGNNVKEKDLKCTKKDSELAKALQKGEDDKLEEMEFKKLQEKYGMSSNGGYTKQFSEKINKQVGRNVSIGDYFKRKTNMMCSMMTGEDSNETRTTGIIPVLSNYYLSGMKGISQVHLCSEVNHYAADISDNGWGCGYRNSQMLFSSLLLNSLYKVHIEKRLGISTVPSVPKIQSCIEEAWKEGFDPSGKEQLGGKLCNTKKWIGTTEVVALFRWMNIRARIVDFHKAQNKVHPLMFQWVADYFRQNSDEQIPPLYIQHQGHSRTIIGLEEHSGSADKNLLLIDPSNHRMHFIKELKPPFTKVQTKVLRKSLYQMKCNQFQLVFIDGVYKSESERNASKILSSIRIPPD